MVIVFLVKLSNYLQTILVIKKPMLYSIGFYPSAINKSLIAEYGRSIIIF